MLPWSYLFLIKLNVSQEKQIRFCEKVLSFRNQVTIYIDNKNSYPQIC